MRGLWYKVDTVQLGISCFALCAVLEQLSTDEDKEQWSDGLQQLKELGMDDDLAEKSLKRGFGWSSQAYWWKEKVEEVPKPGEASMYQSEVTLITACVL